MRRLSHPGQFNREDMLMFGPIALTAACELLACTIVFIISLIDPSPACRERRPSPGCREDVDNMTRPIFLAILLAGAILELISLSVLIYRCFNLVNTRQALSGATAFRRIAESNPPLINIDSTIPS